MRAPTSREDEVGARVALSQTMKEGTQQTCPGGTALLDVNNAIDGNFSLNRQMTS